MNQDLNILHLVAQASLVVQLVMAILLSVSLASWAVIFGNGYDSATGQIGRAYATPSPAHRWSASSPPGCVNTSSCANAA